MKIKITQVGLDELDVFYNLFSKLLYNQFPEYSKKKINYFLRDHWSKQYYRKSLKLKNRLLLGAWMNGSLVGLLDSNKPSFGVSMCTWLMVDPENQKMGIGKKLLSTWVKEVKKLDAHSVYLYADKRNVKYYKSLGFNHIGLWENSWYGNDLNILNKTIQKPKEKNYEA